MFGARGDPSRCWCQRYKMRPGESWASVGADELAFRLRSQTDCGHPRARTTSGLVAYLDSTPVGWCAVEPGAGYARLLLKTRVLCKGRAEEKADPTVSSQGALMGELHPGLCSAFAAAGFSEVGRPSKRRAVMRIDF